MQIVICIVIFSMVFFTVLALLQSISRRDIYKKRLEILEENNANNKENKLNIRLSLKELIQKSSKIFASRSFTENIQMQLIRAGIPLKGEEYMTIWLAFIFLLPLLTCFLNGNIYLTMSSFMFGICVPAFYLKHKKEKRLQYFQQQLGDALLVMANALRAGFGFQQAMDVVRKDMLPPVSTEFTWTLREMNLGYSHEEALINLSKRMGSQDLDMVVSGVIIQRQVGGNLAEILENIAGTIRERAHIQKEVQILTAQGRLSGLIIGILPIILAIIMLIINPDYFTVMINDIRGLIALITAAFWEIIGLLIIRKIIAIDF